LTPVRSEKEPGGGEGDTGDRDGTAGNDLAEHCQHGAYEDQHGSSADHDRVAGASTSDPAGSRAGRYRRRAGQARNSGNGGGYGGLGGATALDLLHELLVDRGHCHVEVVGEAPQLRGRRR
jgi:hypothetical protein